MFIPFISAPFLYPSGKARWPYRGFPNKIYDGCSLGIIILATSYNQGDFIEG